MVSVRKCDESAPQLGYTFDYDSFQKSEFEYETTLEDQPRFQYMIKANKIGSLYMNIRSPVEDSILAITIHYSDSKISGDKNKAGNGGVVSYEIKDSKTAKVTFTGVTCTKSKCDKDISYYWLSSTSMQ